MRFILQPSCATRRDGTTRRRVSLAAERQWRQPRVFPSPWVFIECRLPYGRDLEARRRQLGWQAAGQWWLHRANPCITPVVALHESLVINPWRQRYMEWTICIQRAAPTGRLTSKPRGYPPRAGYVHCKMCAPRVLCPLRLGSVAPLCYDFLHMHVFFLFGCLAFG